MENNTVIAADKVVVKKPRLMLVGKIVLILTVCVLYAMQLSVFLPAYGILNGKDFGDFNFILICVLLGVSLVAGLAALILSISGTVKGEGPLTIITVVAKIIMIPFFCINLYLWIMLVGGMMNPFLLMGIPVVACVGVCLTYVYMLTTSLPDVIFSIWFCLKQKRRPTKLMIIGIICCFIFVADVAGSILLHKTFKDILSVE